MKLNNFQFNKAGRVTQIHVLNILQQQSRFELPKALKQLEILHSWVIMKLSSTKQNIFQRDDSYKPYKHPYLQ